MNVYIKEILKLANKAFMHDEIPVGAVVVKDNKIIGRGYNKKNSTHVITDHAEIIAIKKASAKIGDWRLDECDLYVTLSPCNMCKEVIKQSRIRNVYYLLDSKFYNEKQRTINYKKIQYDACDYSKLLSYFFASKR